MPTIKNIRIDAIESAAEQAKVTVSSVVNFSAAEAGQDFRVAVQLFAWDGTGDDSPGEAKLFWWSPQPLYTYRFGTFPFQRPYKTVKAAGGDLAETVSALVPAKVLDEDPGHSFSTGPGGIKLPLLHFDEVYAAVDVSAHVSKSSELHKQLGT